MGDIEQGAEVCPTTTGQYLGIRNLYLRFRNRHDLLDTA